MVGNCGFGCFPIRDPELARKAIYGYSEDVPIEWTTAGGYFERLERRAPGGERPQPRPERPAAALDGRARRPPGERGRDAADAGAARGVARRGRLGLLDRARVRPGGRRDGGRGRRALPHARPHRRPLRDAHAPPRRGRHRLGRRGDPGGGRRRGAAPGLASRSAERDRGGAPLDGARRGRPGAAGSTSSSTCTRASTASPTSTPRCRRGRSPRSPRSSPSCCATRRPATGCGRTAASSARARTGAAIVLLDNPFWPQYARRDLASIAAERGQQPLDAVYDLLARQPRSAPPADGDHPRLHGGGAARGVRPSALRAGVRRDDARARRAARRHLVPRRLHLGRVVLPLHGPRPAACSSRRRPSTS